MDRLTKRGVVSSKDINDLLELSDDNQFGRNKAYYKLKEYEDLEEQGKLLKLPCSVWTTVYEVFTNTNACYKCCFLTDYMDEEGYWCRNKEVSAREGRSYPENPQFHSKYPLCEKQHWSIKSYQISNINYLVLRMKDFGKTIFCSLSEAEAKLKELEKQDENKFK